MTERTYAPNAEDALFSLRMLDVGEEILTRQGIANGRDTMHTAAANGQLSFRMFEQDESSWLEIKIAGVAIGAVAYRDLMAGFVDGVDAAFRRIVANQETGEME
jgi:hypothetical protein